MATSPEKLWTMPVSVVTTPQMATRKGNHRLGRSFLSTQLDAVGWCHDEMIMTIGMKGRGLRSSTMMYLQGVRRVDG